MSEFLGMNPAEVRQLASQMEQKAEEIESIKSQLTSALHSAQWTGNDAKQYRSEWDSQHVPAMTRVVESLKQAAQTAKRNADTQDQTSGSL